MLSRIIVGIIGVFLLLSVFIKGGGFVLFFAELVILLSTFELYRMIRRKHSAYIVRAMIFSSILPIITYLGYDTENILIILIILLLISEVLYKKFRYSLINISVVIFSTIYISYMFSYTVKISSLDNGSSALIFAFFLIWAADTFAYLVGSLIGKHKFSKISPNKSIEGIFGGFLGVILCARYFGYIHYIITLIFSKIPFFDIYPRYYDFFPSFTKQLFIFAAVVTIIDVLADLFESKIKREYETKDSSNILLGHGGFLDRFDSSMFIIPIVYMYMIYLA